MKKTRQTALAILLLMVLVLTALLVTGCGSSSSMDSSITEYAPSEDKFAEAEDGYDTDNFLDMDGGTGGSFSGESRPYGDDVKLILRAELTLETTDFDATAEQLTKVVSDCGGYFESSNVDMGSYYSDGYRYGYYVVRVPRDQYDGFLNTVGDVCHVTSRNESAEDVGLQYYDLESRIRLLEIKQERLHALLEQASSMEDIISLENALSEIQYQLEYNQSEKNRYDSLIGYSTVEIRLEQVQRLSGEPMQQQDFGSQLETALKQGLVDTVDRMADLLILIAYNIIPLTVFAIILIALLWFAAKRRRRQITGVPKRSWFRRKKGTNGVSTDANSEPDTGSDTK